MSLSDAIAFLSRPWVLSARAAGRALARQADAVVAHERSGVALRKGMRTPALASLMADYAVTEKALGEAAHAYNEPHYRARAEWRADNRVVRSVRFV